MLVPLISVHTASMREDLCSEQAFRSSWHRPWADPHSVLRGAQPHRRPSASDPQGLVCHQLRVALSRIGGVTDAGAFHEHTKILFPEIGRPLGSLLLPALRGRLQRVRRLGILQCYKRRLHHWPRWRGHVSAQLLCFHLMGRCAPRRFGILPGRCSCGHCRGQRCQRRTAYHPLRQRVQQRGDYRNKRLYLPCKAKLFFRSVFYF